jgi:hypothetical protein
VSLWSGAAVGHPVRMHDEAGISLREMTDANRRQIELRVTSEQEAYVAGVEESLAEAAATLRPARGTAPSTPGTSRSAS